MAVNAALIPGSTLKPRRSLTRRVVDIVSTAVTVLFVVIGTLTLVLAVASRFAGNSFTVAGHPMMVVLSGSMSPVISTGDVIIDEQLNGDQALNLHAGQIISFHAAPGSTQIITHRIHRVISAGGEVAYVTKGDVNNAPDASPVFPSQIVGLYDAKIPAAGYVMNAMRQPLILGLLLAAPLLWLLSGFFFKWAREMDQPEDGKAPARRDGAQEETQ